MNRQLLPLAILLSANVAVAADAPIALEKWGRYHVNITPTMQTLVPPKGKKATWRPKVELVFRVTSPESDDIVELQHYRGATKWGPIHKCSLETSNMIKRRDAQGKPMGYSMVRFVCLMDEKHAIAKAGKFSVKVSYKQTGEGKLHKDLAHYKYVVKTYNGQWPAKRGPIKAYYVDHDFRIGEAWLYRQSNGQMQIWSWFKYDRPGEEAVRKGRVRCFVDGNKMAFMESPARRTEISYQHYKPNNKNRKVTWGLWYWYAPRVDGVAAYDWIKQHPGQYRCTLTQQGDIAREFHFGVAADGTINRAPCMTAAGPDQVRAIEDSFLIKTVFKKNADLEFDKKAFRRSPLYGKKWVKGCPP